MIEKHSNAKMQVWQRGFKYTLRNGYTLSCAFGYGNYCDNRHDHNADVGAQIKPGNLRAEISQEDRTITVVNAPPKRCYQIESSDFEVAVFEPNGNMVDLVRTEPDEDGFVHKDQVLGWVPASALPRLIQVLGYWPVRGDFMDGETFEKKFRLRCKQFCGIVKLIQDEADKEDRAASEQADRHA